MWRKMQLWFVEISSKIKRKTKRIAVLIRYKLCKNQLETIVKQLKKYPFDQKMMLCQQCSTRMMKLTYMDILNTPNVVYPWELETFAELSLFAESPHATCSFENPDSRFSDMVNAIRNYNHPFLKKQKNLNFANSFIMATALQQFKVQENILHRLYRYDYFWNFRSKEINMPQEFSDHFNGVTYSDFRDLGILIYF